MLFLNQAYGVGRDAFLAACKAEFLGGRGLDGDIVLIATADLSHTSLHGGDMGIHLRALGTDGGVDIHQPVALRGNEGDGVAENDLAVHAVGFGRGIWEMVANVAHVGGAEKGVADSMQQHIGIAVAKEAFTMFQLNAAHPQIATFY